MPYFLIEAAYTGGAAKAMIAHPQDRSEAVRKTCESLGGRLHSFFFAFGDCDVVVIVELPDNEAAAAVALVVGASGAIARYRTTVLMTPEESLSAMRKAGDVSYIPPG
jgi:uncharacterized protein with GYD domain